MHYFVLFTIACLMCLEFLVKILNLPSALRFVPEVLSAAIALYVVFNGTKQRFRRVAPKYWLVFGCFLLLIVCGIIDNAAGPGQILSGSRFYLRAMPLFFLPAVVQFSERQIKQQLAVLLGFSLLQLPVAGFQRWQVQQEGRYSGDDVRGTLMDSGILSIFLISAVLVLSGMLVRKQISRLQFMVGALILLVPTIINETKGTLVMLPVTLAVVLICNAPRGKRLQYSGFAVVGFAAFVAMFIPIYNAMEAHNPYKMERDITNYFTNQKQLNRYMSSNVGGVGTTKDVRRNDAIGVPLAYIASDPSRLAFGLGIGAASPSNFGRSFEGPYYRLFKNFEITSVTFYELEFGVIGLILIGVLFAMVTLDTLAVARLDTGIIGALATGWLGVVAMAFLGVLYTILHEFVSVTYLGWYFTGMICAQRVSLALEAARAGVPPKRTVGKLASA